MLREADLSTNYTGFGYLQEEIKDFVGVPSSTTSNSFTSTYSRRDVVRDLKPSLNRQLTSYPAVLFNEFNLEATGSELPGLSPLFALFESQQVAETDYRITYVATKLPLKAYISVSSPEIPLSETPAEQLRAISGLEVEPLANIFGVSRTTYHKWINGSFPTRKHREHLLEVLSNVQIAVQRLGSQNATTNWLLTPLSATGKKPIEYLTMGQYSLFRGFLLRVRTGQELVRPLPPSNRIYQKFSKEVVEDTLQRLRPRARVEEDDKEE
jgi:hypothetical protein